MPARRECHPHLQILEAMSDYFRSGSPASRTLGRASLSKKFPVSFETIPMAARSPPCDARDDEGSATAENVMMPGEKTAAEAEARAAVEDVHRSKELSKSTKPKPASTHRRLLEQEALIKNATKEEREEFYAALSHVAILKVRAESQKAELELKRIQLENERLKAENLCAGRLRGCVESSLNCVAMPECRDDDGGSSLFASDDDTETAKNTSKESGGGIGLLQHALNEFTGYVAAGFEFVEEQIQQLPNHEVTSLFGQKTLARAEQEGGESQFPTMTGMATDEAKEEVQGVMDVLKHQTPAVKVVVKKEEEAKCAPPKKEEDISIAQLQSLNQSQSFDESPPKKEEDDSIAQVQSLNQSQAFDKSKDATAIMEVLKKLSEDSGGQDSIMTRKVEIAMAKLGRVKADREAAGAKAVNSVAEAKAIAAQVELKRKDAERGLAKMEEDGSTRARKEKMPLVGSKGSFASMKLKGSIPTLLNLKKSRKRHDTAGDEISALEDDATDVWEDFRLTEAALAEAKREQARAEVEAAQADVEVAAAQEELRRALEERIAKAEMEVAQAEEEVVVVQDELRRMMMKEMEVDSV